jgi:transposase
MPNFKPYNYNQTSMVVINFEEQIQAGTFEYAIHHRVEKKLDTSIFYPNYNNSETGRKAYDPVILLKFVLFAYSKGITSSREIQWNCENNIIFKALSCDSAPHFTTIADFISAHADEILNLFEQILLICDQQGLLGKELFAIDGCKMSSNASKEWSGTHKELHYKRDKIRRQMQHYMDEHQKYDKHQSFDHERQQRIQQSIETLDQGINAYVPDNKFRSRDPKFAAQKQKYGKRHQHNKKSTPGLIAASEFSFDPVLKTCECPSGNRLSLRSERQDEHGNLKLFFEERLLQCRNCDIKSQCMKYPSAADH